jgi:hypothetical protein
MRRLLGGLALAVVVALTVTACGSDDCSFVCADGWCSHAENSQGACSSHGGIAKSQREFHTATSPTLGTF